MTWGSESLESFYHDLATASRLLRSPALTAVALLSLALGIGANTAIFSLLDAVLLRSLPVKDPSATRPSRPWHRKRHWQRHCGYGTFLLPVLSPVASEKRCLLQCRLRLQHGQRCAWNALAVGQSDGQDEIMHAQLVSGNYFPLLGVEPVMGRTLVDGDDASEGDHPVAVVSYPSGSAASTAIPMLNRKVKLARPYSPSSAWPHPSSSAPRSANPPTSGFPCPWFEPFTRPGTPTGKTSRNRSTSSVASSPAFRPPRQPPT